MIISLHPHYEGDFGLRLSLKSLFSEQTKRILQQARAIIVPQSIREEEYSHCRKFTSNLFPDYSHRFGYEGKAGNFLLFEQFGFPHPATFPYPSVEDWKARPSGDVPPLPYPFVLKTDQGGCGFGIFKVQDHQDLMQALTFILERKHRSNGSFVIQELVNHGGRDLRVVLIGDQVHTYWRCQSNPEEFRNNVGRGASIDPHGDPALTTKGVECVLDLRKKTGINLAAVDVMFDKQALTPFITEINFVFGRKGIGGTSAFRKMFARAANDWLQRLGMSPPRQTGQF